MRQVGSRLTELELMMSPEKYTVNNKVPGGECTQTDLHCELYIPAVIDWQPKIGRCSPASAENTKKNQQKKCQSEKVIYIRQCGRQPSAEDCGDAQVSRRLAGPSVLFCFVLCFFLKMNPLCSLVEQANK